MDLHLRAVNTRLIIGAHINLPEIGCPVAQALFSAGFLLVFEVWNYMLSEHF